MKRLRIALWGFAALLTILAGMVLLLPSRLPAARVPGGAESSGSAPAFAAADPTIAENIVVANVFSTRRTPPRSRYSPSDDAMDASGEMPADSTLAPDDPDLGQGMRVPALFGTVVGINGTLALLQLDPTATGPRLYAVGERDGGYRVVSIAPRAVVLTGSRGRVTLRLDREEERP